MLENFGAASGLGQAFVISEIRYLWPRNLFFIPSAMIRTGLKLLGYRLGRQERKFGVRLAEHASGFLESNATIVEKDWCRNNLGGFTAPLFAEGNLRVPRDLKPAAGVVLRTRHVGRNQEALILGEDLC